MHLNEGFELAPQVKLRYQKALQRAVIPTLSTAWALFRKSSQPPSKEAYC
jgi:hypothetical protein